jgi:hypothetical protein
VVNFVLKMLNFLIRLENLKAVINMFVAFWDVKTCSFIDRYQLFGGTCCLPFQDTRVTQTLNVLIPLHHHLLSITIL